MSKKTVPEYLNDVDYAQMKKYVPSEFAIQYINFVKMAGANLELNISPAVHYKMVDGLISKKRMLVNLCHRGLAKTYLMSVNLTLYLAIFQYLPNFGSLNTMIFVADTMENGAKNMRKALESLYTSSPFLQEYLPEARFTDTYIEFKNIDGKPFGLKLYGAKTGVRGVNIFNKRPELCHVKGTVVTTEVGTHRVEDYYKIGNIRQEHGKVVKVHGLPQEEIVTNEHRYWCTKFSKHLPTINGKRVTTYEQVTEDWVEAQALEKNSHYIVKPIDMSIGDIPAVLQYHAKIDQRNEQGQVIRTVAVPYYKPYEITATNEFAWLYGLYLADGHITSNRIGFSIANTQRDTAGKTVKEKCNVLGLTLNAEVQKEGCYQVSFNDSVIYRFLKENHLGNSQKHIPYWVTKMPLDWQKELLLGYIAGDGYVTKNQIRINSIHLDALKKLGLIAERLGLPYHIRCTRSKEIICTFPNGVTSVGKRQWEIRFKDNVKEVLGFDVKPNTMQPSVFIKDGCIYRKVKSVEDTEQIQEFVPIQTPTHTYLTEFGISHNCIFDDLLSTADANSATVVASVKETIYKDVMPALHPTRRKVIFNGTPFNKNDPIYEAVESGAWEVNVYPVCEEFPCSRKEFNGSWEDRFTFDFVKEQYDLAVATGELKAFNQEYMLRIASEEDKMVHSSDLQWFDRNEILKNKQQYNFYITTDFATSVQRKADFTVIGVWAVDNKQNRYLVDGVIGRQLMNQTFDDLFSFVSMYQPLGVGIEISGQQGAFISLLREEMVKRDTYFHIASAKGRTAPGIPAQTNKMNRLRLSIPFIKAYKLHLPNELKESKLIQELLDELDFVTIDGIKSKHDDALDMLSQLDQMHLVYPDEYQSKLQANDDAVILNNRFFTDTSDSNNYYYNGYLV